MSHDRRGPATALEGVPRDDDAAALSRIQQVISRVVPAAWTASMEAESRAWMVRCRSCGYERSIWELGGIRATRSPHHWRRNPSRGISRLVGVAGVMRVNPIGNATRDAEWVARQAMRTC